MSFDLENGYQPRTFAEVLQAMVDAVNAQFGTTYDTETIVGTEFYKFFYCGAQLVMQAENYTAQITAKMTDYIRTANENIALPKSTIDGFVNAMKDELGLDATIKNITDEAEAGHLFCCVDVSDGVHATGSIEITNYSNLTSGGDDSITINGVEFVASNSSVTLGDATFYAHNNNNDTAASLAAQINGHATASQYVVAEVSGAIITLTSVFGGVDGNSITLAYTDGDTSIGATVSGATLTGGENSEYQEQIIDKLGEYLGLGLYYEGVETGNRTAANGQVFSYGYDVPTAIDILVRITVTVSNNTLNAILNENQVRDIFNANFAELYKLGLDFEPEKYLEIARDLPFASNILLEYSEDAGSSWDDQPRVMAYNEKINITAPATITIN